jgi:arabinan endo-1,5-alpha-L-arabinosidase
MYYSLISSMAKTVINSLLTGLYAVYKAGTSGSSGLNTNLLSVYNAESNANDSKGSNNGTATGGLTYSSGKVGNAFIFNGSSYVKLPNSAFNSLMGDFSVSFWFYGNGSGTTQEIFGNNSYNGVTFKGFRIYQRSTYQIEISLNGGGGTTLLTTSSIINGVWHHIAVTRLGNTRSRIYLNGVLAVSNADTRNPEYFTNTTPTIGALDYNPNFALTTYYCANGTKIDAVNVWNREISSTEVTELYNSALASQYSSSVGAFILSNVNDSYTNGYNGVAQGTLTYGVGKSGNCFVGNGTDACIKLNNNLLNFTGNFSVVAWVKVPSTSAGIKTIVSNNKLLLSPTRQYGWGCYINNTNITFQKYDGSGTVLGLSYDLSSSLTANVWHLFVFTYSTTTGRKIYFDGSMVTSDSNVTAIAYDTTHYPTLLAQRYDGVNYEYFNSASLDEVLFYNTKELTSTEVTSLYDAGAGKFYPTF